MKIDSREYPRKRKFHSEGKPYLEYQWITETLDKDGEIINIEANDINDFPGLPEKGTDIALRRISGVIDNEGQDLGGDYSYAYLEEGNLSPTWDRTKEKVPAKWRKIVANQINNLRL